MIYILVGLVGLSLGSFVNALVWRIRHNEEVASKSLKKKKTSPLADSKLSIINGRSICTSCKHQLAWNDLIPVVSWLSLGGKCRYCHKKISVQYPLVELLVGAVSVASLAFWPFELGSNLSWVIFAFWLISLAPMVAIALYDIKYGEMPTNLVYSLGVIGGIFTLLISLLGQSWAFVVSSIIGTFCLGGFFLILHMVSGGSWIGGGDVRYGFVMGIILGWQKAIFALALASYLGTALVIVLFVLRKYHKRMRIPFGPFLITATILSMLYGQVVIDWYKGIAGL